jgi:hypothetical protein
MHGRSLLTFCSIVILGGCHTYTPAPGTDVLAEERVRLEFIAPRPLVFGSVTTAPVARLEGVIVQMPADSIRLRVVDAWDATGASVVVPPSAVATVARRDLVAADRREISRGRTALIVAGAAVAFVAILAVAFGGE